MRRFLIFAAGAMLFISSCSKDDSSSLKDRIAGADRQLAEMEVLSSRIRNDISGLATVLEEAQAGNLILKCEATSDGAGYVITFSDGQVASVSNGLAGHDGKDGKDASKDGECPQVSVRKDHTGAYCWTVDGEFMTDSEGNHIYLTLNVMQGRDGVVPMFRVLDGRWQVSYTGGEVWIDLGDSSKGSPYIFESVSVDGVLVNFTLSDGSVFSLYRVVDPLLAITGWENLSVVPNRSMEVGYSVSGASPLTKVYAVANSGMSAEVIPDVSSLGTGRIRIDAPAVLTDGDILVTADNGYGRVSMKKISFERGTILVSDIEPVEGVDPFIW